ncbi:MAG TPA: ABC transporter permease [Candidatus Sumerlaeota bacterium]|nr:MAG: Glutathione transport system permease protein GsiC [candidate division BRC1 bacterium ADurb.BinA292]HOE97986.1 ABC transporter permease [Candidatus Sumerlaeota bacterium]HOR27194.1 ABC transporter permease [Candidatus Sumerlaeota bacterium]HPK02187.1 ABC transporter permease [Candidatus Sumerlaeota bacterium]
MLRFLLRRLFHGLLILLGVSFLTFFLINQSPGDFLDRKRLDPQVPREFIEAEIQRLHLDQPWPVVYCFWLKDIVTRLDFGRSFEYKQPVFDVLAGRVLNTLILSFCSVVFAWMLAIPLGIIAGYRQYSLVDKTASAVAFLGVSVPNVFLALLAIFLAARTGWFPTGGLTDQRNWPTMSTAERMLDMAHHLILPTIVLGTGMMAVLMRQMRGQLLDVLQADYIRTARAKGVGERALLLKHAVRNAINPLITIFGFSLSTLLSGSVLVEKVMSYPGLGRLTVDAMFNKDIYLVMASVLVATAMLVLGNLIADLLLAWSDPRIKLEDRATS